VGYVANEPSQHSETQEVTNEEYKNLAKRIDSMESSVALVLTKVEKENLEFGLEISLI
jgi:hypothetical protein